MPSNKTTLTNWPTAGPPAWNQAKPDATTKPPATRQTPASVRGESCLRLPVAAYQMAKATKTPTPASIVAIGTKYLLSMVNISL
jgi:hypothetical protein